MEWNGMEFLGFGADVYSEGESERGEESHEKRSLSIYLLR